MVKNTYRSRTIRPIEPLIVSQVLKPESIHFYALCQKDPRPRLQTPILRPRFVPDFRIFGTGCGTRSVSIYTRGC